MFSTFGGVCKFWLHSLIKAKTWCSLLLGLGFNNKSQSVQRSCNEHSISRPLYMNLSICLSALVPSRLYSVLGFRFSLISGPPTLSGNVLKSLLSLSCDFFSPYLDPPILHRERWIKGSSTELTERFSLHAMLVTVSRKLRKITWGSQQGAYRTAASIHHVGSYRRLIGYENQV